MSPFGENPSSPASFLSLPYFSRVFTPAIRLTVFTDRFLEFIGRPFDHPPIHSLIRPSRVGVQRSRLSLTAENAPQDPVFCLFRATGRAAPPESWRRRFCPLF